MGVEKKVVGTVGGRGGRMEGVRENVCAFRFLYPLRV